MTDKPYVIKILDTVVENFNKQHGSEIVRYTARVRNYCFSSVYLFDVYVRRSDGIFREAEHDLTQTQFASWLSGFNEALGCQNR